MAINLKRLAVARMAQHLATGYYAFVVAHHVAVNPVSINSLSPAYPTGKLARKDDTVHTINLRYYPNLLREDRSLQGDFLRLWVTRALLSLGDELSKHGYFDHAPILELIYHVRNGIAHGNRFHIVGKGRQRLANYAAYNRYAAVKSPLRTLYEIMPNLTGPVLFDFMGAADVIDLLQSVEIHLSQ